MTALSVSGPLLLAAFALALVYGCWLTYRPVGLWRSLVKTVATGLLALVALLLSAPIWLIAALGLGALGDWFLSRDGDRAFLAGLTAFALSHLAYIALLMGEGGSALWPWTPAQWAVLVLAGGMAVLLFRAAGPLRWAVLIYVAIIAAMALTAISLASAAPLACLAALLFVTSDSVLGAELFLLRPGHPARRVTPALLWALYWAAQFCFLAAFSLIWIT